MRPAVPGPGLRVLRVTVYGAPNILCHSALLQHQHPLDHGDGFRAVLHQDSRERDLPDRGVA